MTDIYIGLWVIGWLLAGLYVLQATKNKSLDPHLRPLAYVCFIVAAGPFLVWLAYYVAGLILFIWPRDFIAQ